MCGHSDYFPFLISFKVKAKPYQEIDRQSTFFLTKEVNSTLKWELLKMT